MKSTTQKKTKQKKSKLEPVLSQFKGKPLTDFIKLQLMKYFRFDRSFIFVCSECINHSDISAINNTSLIEVEVKISKSDFLAEFNGKSRVKKYKHLVMSDGKSPYSRYIVPNYYYFCTTPELKDYVLTYLKENGHDKYGLLICDEKRQFNKRSHIYCVKQAKKIHDKKPTEKTFEKVAKRVQSEMIGLIEKKFLLTSK